MFVPELLATYKLGYKTLFVCFFHVILLALPRVLILESLQEELHAGALQHAILYAVHPKITFLALYPLVGAPCPFCIACTSWGSRGRLQQQLVTFLLSDWCQQVPLPPQFQSDVLVI